MATGLCLVYVIIEQQQAPYLRMSDNVIALAASFSLTMFFFCCILLKLGLLLEQEDIRVRLSTRLRGVFEVPADGISIAMFSSVVLTLAFAAFSLSVQIEHERKRKANARLAEKARRLRYIHDNAEVVPPPVPPGHFHIFLSHVWSTGQDQMRVVKQRLGEMIPGLSVFLDVDVK